MRKRKAEKGFTLLEVLIALAITGGLLVSIIQVVNYHLSVVDRYESRALSLMLGKQKLEEMKDSPDAAEGKFPPPYSDFSYKSEVSEGPLPGLGVLTLTVTRGREHATLSAFIRK